MKIFVRKTERVLEREWSNEKKKKRVKNRNEIKEIGTQ
jgi:hypothetical protein